MTTKDKGLGDLLGAAGKGKVPVWVKLVTVGALVLVAWVIAGDWGLFLVIGVTGGWAGWDWWHDKGNFVASLRDFVLFSALLATALRGPMTQTSDGFKGIGPAVVSAGQQRWNDAHAGPVGPPVSTPTTPPPTTQAPPATSAP